MAPMAAELPQSAQITDYISLGVITKTIPLAKICAVLATAANGSISGVGQIAKALVSLGGADAVGDSNPPGSR